MDELDSVNQPAKFPEYQTKQKRLQTFAQQRKIPPNIVTTLVEAGFFFTNNRDSVRCFNCGIQINGAKLNDDPFVKHANMTSSCEYLISSKGLKFVKYFQETTKSDACHDDEPTDDTFLTPGQHNFTRLRFLGLYFGKTKRKREVDEKGRYTEATLRRNALLTDAVDQVLTLGYLPRDVKPVVTEILETEGWNTLTKQAILDKLKSRNKVQNKVQTPERENEWTIKEDSSELLQIKTEDRALCEALLCRRCKRMAEILFLPCLHTAACSQCVLDVDKCLSCHSPYNAQIRVHFPMCN